MIDWRNILTTGKRGVAVEGQDDRVVIEAFLDAGEKQGHWNNWRNRLAIETAKGSKGVLNELDVTTEPDDVWAILDKEWRSEDSIAELENKYTRLLFLPRIMIENYAINPDELMVLLPSSRIKQIGEANLRQTIGDAVGDWVQHGALSQVLNERGARDFCTKTEGYPNRLLNAPVTDENEIESLLNAWHNQLDPTQIMPDYRERLTEFRRKSSSEQYHQCIEGKRFFQEIVVGKVLNRTANKKESGKWLEELFKASVPTQCPPDLIPILKKLIE